MTSAMLLPSAVLGKEDGRRVLEEVIVTAQKRAQSLQEIPMSVSAISGDMATDAAIVDTTDLVQYTPNVKFTAANPAYSSTSIRGFGTPPLAQNLEPSVGLVIDGVSYGRSTFTNDAVFDLERLEVLRGPQGTLFGKNTVAGVLNFTTAAPSFDLSGYINVAEESLDGKRYEAALGFPIIDDVLAARISWRKRDKSFGLYNTTRNNEEEQFKDESMRLKLDWFPFEGGEINLLAFKSDFESVGNGMQHSHITPSGFQVYREADPQTEDDEFNNTRATNAPTFTSRFSEAIALKMSVDTGDNWVFRNASLTAIASRAQVDTPYLLDSDFGPVNALSLETDGPDRYKQEQFELRYTADSDVLFGWGDSVDWVIGMFVGESHATVTQFARQNLTGLAQLAPLIAEGRGVPNAGAAEVAALNALIGAVPNGEQDVFAVNYVRVFAESYALFAQADWHLSSSLTTSLGIRLGKETKDGANGSFANTPVPALVAGQENFDNEGSKKEYEVSPKLAVSWSPSDELTVFGNIAKGFKSGGYSG
ncbi:TonB-dependent receptor, partial [Litorivivens sp.]